MLKKTIPRSSPMKKIRIFFSSSNNNFNNNNNNNFNFNFNFNNKQSKTKKSRRYPKQKKRKELTTLSLNNFEFSLWLGVVVSLYFTHFISVSNHNLMKVCKKKSSPKIKFFSSKNPNDLKILDFFYFFSSWFQLLAFAFLSKTSTFVDKISHLLSFGKIESNNLKCFWKYFPLLNLR